MRLVDYGEVDVLATLAKVKKLQAQGLKEKPLHLKHFWIPIRFPKRNPSTVSLRSFAIWKRVSLRQKHP